jgi:glycosyltransferase involved in cell wall biosynthesis
LVPAEDATALARAIDELLAAPERRAAMGKAGRARVLEQFTWQAAAQRTVDAYREVIAERGDGGDGGHAC